MRKLLLMTFVAALIGFLTQTVAAQTQRTKPHGIYLVQTLPKEPISKEEINDLLHMREEEKLARDVYLTLSNYYPFPVFRNIARSEEQHMRIIKLLLNKYSLPDPVEASRGKVGVFKDPKLQELYNKLVSQGSFSLIDALKVGATIEDLDIKDLEEALSRTDNKDIRVVYQELMKSSRNHMRAFIRLLRRYGSDYQSRYISSEEFNSILSVKHEAGFYSFGSTYLGSQFFEGKVLKVSREPGFRRKDVMWWVVRIETPQGEVPVRVAPVWWLPQFEVKAGDFVKVIGFRPPYWNIRGVNGYMACKLIDKTAGKTYDFSKWRRWCRR
ncbi:MAG: DUF2202 domain-containing protein [Desulfurobacteriaceae bacterium]